MKRWALFVAGMLVAVGAMAQPTATHLFKEQVDDSAGLAGVLSDETGSGAACFATGPTLTDAIAATSFQLPNGTAPTVNAAGEIAEDTTANQLVYGSAPNVLHPDRCSSAIIENLAADDDNYSLGMTDFARTITAVGVHCDGTCSTAADIDLSDRAGNAMTHGAPTVSTGTGNTTFTSVTAANTLVAGEGLEFSVANAVSPETDTYTITFCYTIDRQ